MLNQTTPISPGLSVGIRAAAALTVILVGVGLYVLGAQPVAVGLFSAPWDKLAHMATFALVGAATGLASGKLGWRAAVCCVAGAIVMGAVDEWHQASLPGRQSDWLDLGADAAGGLLGAVLLHLGNTMARKKIRSH